MPVKKSFPLRIDPELYGALEHWAADELRSVNAHIEFLLREAARRAGRLGGTSITRLKDKSNGNRHDGYTETDDG